MVEILDWKMVAVLCISSLKVMKRVQIRFCGGYSDIRTVLPSRSLILSCQLQSEAAFIHNFGLRSSRSAMK